MITSWSYQEPPSTLPGGIKLKVARNPIGARYTITAEAAADNPTAGMVNTYQASIPVQAGDLIGISTSGGGNCGSGNAHPADTTAYLPGDQAVGTTMTYTRGTGILFPVSAQVMLQPGVSSVSPSSGRMGAEVTITGHDFLGATVVSFGGTAAQSFTVNSDTTITAVAPGSPAGTSDVTVTTPGGRSPVSAADQFTLIPPTVASVSPSRGPRTGGTVVTIIGQDFTGATGVLFGSSLASSFSVVSDTVIRALSPRAPAGPVDITVLLSGAHSAATAADRFTFNQVCVVPKLKGETSKAAKKALGRAHCGVGGVTGPVTGRVKHQSRKPGRILSAGTKVNLTLT